MSDDVGPSSTPTGPEPAPVQGPANPRVATAWMDLARVVAIVAVVLIHALAPGVNGRWLEVGGGPWWLANVLESATRWCVPVFIMISGALLLDPRRIERPRDFYRKRLSRVGIPLVVWTVVYLGYRSWGRGEDLTTEQARNDVLLGAPFLQMYFLYVLVGLYLLAPFFKLVVRHSTPRMQAGFAGVLLALGMVDQVASSVTGVNPTVATRFVPFAGFFVAGWVLRDLVIRRWMVITALVVFALASTATAVLVGAVSVGEGWGTPGQYLYSFLSPSVVLQSLAVYVLFRALGTRWAVRSPNPTGGLVARLSPLTFGIFLVHPLILEPIQRRWALTDSVGPFLLDVLLHTTITLAASLVITRALMAVPGLRRTVS